MIKPIIIEQTCLQSLPTSSLFKELQEYLKGYLTEKRKESWFTRYQNNFNQCHDDCYYEKLIININALAEQLTGAPIKLSHYYQPEDPIFDRLNSMLKEIELEAVFDNGNVEIVKRIRG